MAADSSINAEKTQIAPTVFVAKCPATAYAIAGGSEPAIDEIVICHQLIDRVVPAMIDITSAKIGTGRVATIATIPHRSSNREARAYSASLTKRRTFSLPARPMANPVSEQPVEPMSERSDPIQIPNSAPCAIMITLEGTGSTTSAMRSPTPITPASGPAFFSIGIGSVSSGTPNASAMPKHARKMPASASEIQR
ncbi:MAG: hypothetical protein QOC81_2602 [Thermoanaerobaculia bacterium]|nr:hypothetical protein [Thermoanaerobaculia bacterium]